MKSLPKLFKKTNTGKIQEWQVLVSGNQVITKFGQVGGKIQQTADTVKGKNIGKVNETTDEQQAEVKAKQMWQKKIKDRYVKDIKQAEKGESSVECFKPMLAHPIEKKEKKVEFPAIAQPKLDGLRCLAVKVEGGDFRLFTRTGKPITTLPHIIKELSEAFKHYDDIGLDGELYNHEFKDDFNKIVSVIKRDKVHEDHKLIQYHIYDVVEYNSYAERFSVAMGETDECEFLIALDYSIVKNRSELDEYFHECLRDGYEGAMYRHETMPYEHKRSDALLKVKVMDDAEFKVVDVQEGNGKLQGKAGAFICELEDGRTFKAKMKGELENLTEYFVNFDKYKGKMLTVQFQGLTPKKAVNNLGEEIKVEGGMPRFPVGLRFREEE